MEANILNHDQTAPDERSRRQKLCLAGKGKANEVCLTSEFLAFSRKSAQNPEFSIDPREPFTQVTHTP